MYQCGLTLCVHFVPNRVSHDKVKDWGQGSVWKGMVAVQHESFSTVGFGVSLILQYQTSDVSYRQEHPAASSVPVRLYPGTVLAGGLRAQLMMVLIFEPHRPQIAL